MGRRLAYGGVLGKRGVQVVESENVVVLPAPALRPFVRSYKGFSYRGLDAGVHEGLPSGDVTFIVSLDGPTHITRMPGQQSPGCFDALVGGLHSRPASIAHPGHGAGISIDLSPLASRALLGVPAAALAGSVVELSDLVGRAGIELVDRLHAAASWRARFDVVDDVLTSLARADGAGASEVRRAWQMLVASGGRSRIADLARDVGWSRRHLAARFGSELGMTPKMAARILRFERACRLLDQGLDAAEAATTAGYFDQSHMSNDWREFAGATPLEWLGDDLRDRTLGKPADREAAGSHFSKTPPEPAARMQ